MINYKLWLLIFICLVPVILSQKTGKTKCIKGTFYDSETKTCQKCVENCEICESAKACKECNEYYLLDEKTKTCNPRYSEGVFIAYYIVLFFSCCILPIFIVGSLIFCYIRASKEEFPIQRRRPITTINPQNGFNQPPAPRPVLPQQIGEAYPHAVSQYVPPQ